MTRQLVSGVLMVLAISATNPWHLVQAETLVLSDTFDVGGEVSDINANLATRQAGTLAPSSYTDFDSSAGWGAVAEIRDDALALTAPYISGQPLKAKSTVALDSPLNALANTISSITLSVSLENVGGDNWAAITLDGTKDADLPGASDVAFVVRPDTTYDLWVNGTKVIDENDTNHGLFFGLEHDVIFFFDESEPGVKKFDLTVDGATVIADRSYTTAEDRYLILQTFALGATGGVDVTHCFDNLQVRIVPEPLGMFFLFTGILCLSVTRRRKR